MPSAASALKTKVLLLEEFLSIPTLSDSRFKDEKVEFFKGFNITTYRCFCCGGLRSSRFTQPRRLTTTASPPSSASEEEQDHPSATPTTKRPTVTTIAATNARTPSVDSLFSNNRRRVVSSERRITPTLSKKRSFTLSVVLFRKCSFEYWQNSQFTRPDTELGGCWAERRLRRSLATSRRLSMRCGSWM